MSSSSSNPFGLRITAASATSASFSLTAAAGGAALPFTLGFGFRKGEVPSGSGVVGSIPNLQVVPQTTWPDGSLRFAVVSGRADLVSGTPLTVRLARTAAPVPAPALTLANLVATNLTAAISTDQFGAASWSGNDWNAPFLAWVSGPQMSSWIYRKPIGSDQSLVGWLEVRLYAGGAVEVLPWVENGYLKVPNPSNRNTTWHFSLGGNERFAAAFDLPHHTRTVLLSGTELSYWLGAPVRVVPNHDKAYLQATGLVPSYRAAVASNATLWGHLPTSYAPLQQGGYSNAMGSAGYQPTIGPLPEWDVVYLCSNDARAYAAVLFNAFSAGRFGIHYRDETTQRPIRFSSYPHLLFAGGASSGLSGVGASTTGETTPVTSGTAPPVYDLPHHPSMGYLAFLITGRFYFLEELQFLATTNFLLNPDAMRLATQGVFQTTTGSNTTRGAGWAVRTLAQAASATPDSDPLRAEFLSSLASNIAWYHGRYVAQPNNPQGFVAPYSNYNASSGKYMEAAWMQDFVTAAFGLAQELDLPLPAARMTQLSEFFAWKARSIIGRLGGTAPTEYLYRDAAVYTIAVAPETNPDFTNGTGPWYANWGEVYSATLGTPNPGQEGDLRGSYFPDATSYWGNLQPAMAYAVQFGVPGAREAYARMTGASNWPAMVSNFNVAPVWSVRPRGQ